MSTTQQHPDRTRALDEESVGGRSAGGRPWLIVATREVIVRVMSRTFLFSTLFTVVFIAGFAAFSAWQAGRTTTYTVAVAAPDATRLVEQAATAAKAGGDDSTVITPTTVSGEPAARAAVTAGDADAWLHKTPNGWTLTAGDDAPTSLRTPVETAVRQAALQRNAAAAGTDVATLQQGATLTADRFDGQATNRGVAQVATFAFALLFLLGALMFGQQIAASVVEEKQSRIIEIIATAIPLRALLAGKVLGNSVIALGQIIVFSAA
ncbi:MAG: ABC transporter permease, partial [Humibacillus sp.]